MKKIKQDQNSVLDNQTDAQIKLQQEAMTTLIEGQSAPWQSVKVDIDDKLASKVSRAPIKVDAKTSPAQGRSR
jgi:hypothetical protein